jgi:hypothetical protein
MADKKRAAALLVEARVVGNRDKRAPAVPRAAAVAEVGEGEGNAHGFRKERSELMTGCIENATKKLWRMKCRSSVVKLLLRSG